MRLFNIFKKKHKNIRKPSPKKQLGRLLEYIPDFYKDHRQYKNATDYFEHHEWELTLESLIELTEETGHYFSEEFWETLADTAKAIDMAKLSMYCSEQITRNQLELKSKTPFGWTTIKIDDSHFQHYIAEKLKQEWVAKRQKKDKVDDLIKKDGIYLKSHGRSGFIYIVDNGQLAEIEFELGVNGFILYFNDTTNWIMPLKRVLTVEEKQNIKTAIESWASNTKNAIEFEE